MPGASGGQLLQQKRALPAFSLTRVHCIGAIHVLVALQCSLWLFA